MVFDNCSMDDFLKKENKIICFGCGNYFQAFLDECKWRGRVPNIIAVADNYAPSETISAGDTNINVIGTEELEKIMLGGENILIVITTAYYREIAAQLESNPSFHNAVYYAYPLMQLFALEKKVRITGMEKEPVIPKKIHYCWFGGQQLPDEDRRFIEGWKEKCPDYEIIEWNEQNYDVEKCPYMIRAYENRKWAFVSDYARLDILFRQGGFYFDTDVEIIKDISPLRYHRGFMGVEAAGGIASGLGCGFEQGHPMLREMMQQYEDFNLCDTDSTGKTVWQVNANFETRVFRKYGFIRNNEFQIIRNVAIYPFDFFSPLIVGSKEKKITVNTYSVHHYHYSWRR